jgi:hypothetical protein
MVPAADTIVVADTVVAITVDDGEPGHRNRVSILGQPEKAEFSVLIHQHPSTAVK